MNKFKRFGVSILSLGLVLALNPVTTFAAEPETSVVTSESNAVGGWSEEDGYFVNPQAYSKAMEDGTTYASPKHTGRAEERTHNGTSQKKSTWLDYLGWKISLHKSKNGRLGCNSYRFWTSMGN